MQRLWLLQLRVSIPHAAFIPDLQQTNRSDQGPGTSRTLCKETEHAMTSTQELTTQLPDRVEYRPGTSRIRPFMRTSYGTDSIMGMMMTALIVIGGGGIFRYGPHALLLCLVSTVSAVAAEAAYSAAAGRGLTIRDYSAAVSGLMLGLILPPAVPVYFAAIGAAGGIILGKCLFGGIGRNLINPAMTGKLIMISLIRNAMGDFYSGNFGTISTLMQITMGNSVSTRDVLTGNVSACIGTGSILLILAASVFLLLSGVITLTIPLSGLVSFTAMMILFGHHGWRPGFLMVELCGGSFLFTLFLMATDYSTSPVTGAGQVLYGVIFGILTAVLRLFFGRTEHAVVISLLLTNLTARFLDQHTMPRPFGLRRPGSRFTVPHPGK